MLERNLFANLSPLDHRYYLSNRDVFERLSQHLSENGSVGYLVRVEAALLESVLEELGIWSESHAAAIAGLEQAVSPEAVAAEEEKTQHNIRALVHVIKQQLPDEIAQYVHVGATSVDILDTANALKIRGAVRKVILPELVKLQQQLVRLAAEHADTVQVGRTHGQYAVPVTFGFAIAEYASRLGKAIIEIETRSTQLRGKIAGAVGAYNAISMVSTDPQGFEQRVLGRLQIEASEHSTQMVEPEYLTRLLVEINIAFGIIANLADDLRNLQRSEIDEVREHFGLSQVGSSTMPQKRNPWNSEHVKSLWKAFAPRIMTVFMDQISEHQRDLSNSASGRFVVDYLAGFTAAVCRMTRVVSGIAVNQAGIQRNLQAAGDSLLAEPAYILLALGGVNHAHEVIRQATLRRQETGETLMSILQEDVDSWGIISDRLEALGIRAEEFFADPAQYTGRAAAKAREIAARHEKLMNELQQRLQQE
ncbi:lyase family protein [Spirochaeta africana]|uniref:Adenylosuccinate lyase n=1 Tax=Spirochaeta africana (strain ATCC 700263 / DSM 8902 / Z-7692) TaxID=889378 RepID=H9UJH6_SPIAZ|nr:lyase family protein [Spirochaeta africana]AFG37669.1 adenylosuccinate lyase [Spirochaeta africana DSM 8902]